MNADTPFYNFLLQPEYRMWRHTLLALAGIFISINYVMPREGYGSVGLSFIALYFLTIIISYMLVIYFNIYVLIPRYLIRKKYLLYLASLSVSVCVMLAAQYGLEKFFSAVTEPAFFTIYNTDNNFILFLDIFSNFFLNLLAFIGCSVTVLLKHWIVGSERAGRLERQHIQAEVDRLKEQANPDFMFSTLRSIGALEESNPQKASAMLIRLSHLLRYQLYDCSRDEVFLSSEIQYLNNYLSLRQLSYDKLRFDIGLTGETLRALVPPLLFLPFVQDTVNRIIATGAAACVNLSFYADDECVRFGCINENHTGTDAVITDFSKIEQRLRLLFGEGYRLEASSSPFFSQSFIHLQIMYRD